VLDRLASQHAQFVKIMVLFSEEYLKRKDDPKYRGFRGLNPDLIAPIVIAAHRRGLRVAAHIETAHDFRVIVDAHVDEAAHMPGYRTPDGPIEPFFISDEDAQAAARTHIVVVPTASLAGFSYEKDPKRIAAVQNMQRENLLKLKRAHVPLLIGTDQMPDSALDEVHYLLKLGVFTPKEALISLTETTPQYIFPGRPIGVLAPGYEASFLVIGSDPTGDIAALQHIEKRIKLGAELTNFGSP
jgi:imidazolonepropionase-like amidohydrolase